jgi:hypothetical protein
MLSEINIVSNNIFEQHVIKIMNQTNYTKEEATNKLILFNNDYIKVIKDYMNIPIHIPEEKKVKSVNQEIFRQIRIKLDNSMKNYRDNNPINVEQVIDNFNESDERKKNKI